MQHSLPSHCAVPDEVEPRAACPPNPCSDRSDALLRRGFSLTELVVVLAIAVLLTGLLFPAMSEIRETAKKVHCASNERQLGMALFMYAGDWEDALPPSKYLVDLDQPRPQELMAAHTGEGIDGWDGTGLLYLWKYCDAPGCYYCPSHHGVHTQDRYHDLWLRFAFINDPIYTNYHYAGDRDWVTGRPRRLHESPELILLSDGLRTQLDFNHVVGMNVFKADGAVVWRDDNEGLYARLPDDEIMSDADAAAYRQLWAIVEKAK